ncbi:hypothetical protein TWF569_000085 [Orbilia oligospora]|uniref:Uncharacterized protein n=1 Tax=Orbilia oligospora TaxID=2813651 RepID=A0A7C8JCW4_ORBOL|nr:hypothetical protein TWF102_003108 [Orbilia oligospora]KAF3112175.1 hypothetical protein TWF706_010775 [Orbilia oligospora]KAF3114045.1 hypothetical protein TWF103_001487 [Orbilia oligospora]KAF3157511.1 hypothetical protein TWF569_000085 [Orbilia oligospora]KAF3173917.1 hypothetical protein TWF751_005068 [Orbilia oligospora]
MTGYIGVRYRFLQQARHSEDQVFGDSIDSKAFRLDDLQLRHAQQARESNHEGNFALARSTGITPAKGEVIKLG